MEQRSDVEGAFPKRIELPVLKMIARSARAIRRTNSVEIEIDLAQELLMTFQLHKSMECLVDQVSVDIMRCVLASVLRCKSKGIPAV